MFKELGLDKDTADEALVEAMSANPILIERPIVVHDEAQATAEACWSCSTLFAC